MCIIVSFWDTSLSTCHIPLHGRNLLEWRHLLYSIVCNLLLYHFRNRNCIIIPKLLYFKLYSAAAVTTDEPLSLHSEKFVSITLLNHWNKIILYCLDQICYLSMTSHEGETRTVFIGCNSGNFIQFCAVRNIQLSI